MINIFKTNINTKLLPDQYEKIKVLGYATNLFYTGSFFQLLTRIKWIYMSFEA